MACCQAVGRVLTAWPVGCMQYVRASSMPSCPVFTHLALKSRLHGVCCSGTSVLVHTGALAAPGSGPQAVGCHCTLVICCYCLPVIAGPNVPLLASTGAFGEQVLNRWPTPCTGSPKCPLAFYRGSSVRAYCLPLWEMACISAFLGTLAFNGLAYGPLNPVVHPAGMLAHTWWPPKSACTLPCIQMAFLGWCFRPLVSFSSTPFGAGVVIDVGVGTTACTACI